MKIGICSDHAGVEYKSRLISYLLGKGYEVVNFGTDSTESMDYADVAHPLATAVENGEVDRGIALCGTGNGMAMTLNHHRGIRAGLAWNTAVGKLVKEHNDANFIAFGGRIDYQDDVLDMVKAYISTQVSQDERHARRRAKMMLLEN